MNQLFPIGSLRAIPVILLCALLTACAGNPTFPPLGQTTHFPVAVSGAGNPNYAPIYLARELGYFADEKLDVDIQVHSAAEALPLLLKGDLYAFATGPDAGLLNAMNRDSDTRMVTVMGLPGPGLGCCQIVTRGDLFAAGQITKVTDVKGRTIASPVGINSIVTYQLAKWLDQGGLKLSDVKLAQMGLNDIAAGLAAKRIEVGYLAVPTLTPLLDNGTVKIVGDFDAVRHGLPSPGLVMGGKMLKEHPEIAAAFLRAVLRAVDHDLQGNYLADPRVAAALSKALNLQLERVKTLPLLSFPRGLPVDAQALDSIQRFFVEGGFTDYKQPIPAERLVDLRVRSAAEAAVAAMH